MKPLRILVACEFSGTVRNAFRALGHEAWSCDLLPDDSGSEYHIQGDIKNIATGGFDIFDWKWDLMIAHPPCTYLCNSGVCWLSKGGKLNPERHDKMKLACDFFAALYHAPIPHVAVENPIMHKYAKDYLASAWKIPGPTQSFQPYHHGHGESKRTCLWLRNLPLIVPSNIVSGREQRLHKLAPGPTRWKERSMTYPGIAAALAAQWSAYLTK